MKKDYSDALKDIFRSMTLTQEFIRDCTFKDFDSDEKTQYAVIRCFEVIGEAVKQLPDDFRNMHPQIPWKAMAGMRDRLIHGYDVVDKEIVWNTVTNTIPELIKQMNKLM